MSASEAHEPLAAEISREIEAPRLTLPEVSDGGVSLDLSPVTKDIFAEQKRKAWDKSVEARCDFTYKLRLTVRSNIAFITIWQKSLFGRTLTDIKSDESMIPFFATSIVPVIHKVIGTNLLAGQWAICTTPKRRHLVKNFATLVSEQVAQQLGIPFYEDVAFCRTRERLNAVYDLNILPKEPNIIVFDDFVTTGQTLAAMHNLLVQYDKNIIFFAGINNKL